MFRHPNRIGRFKVSKPFLDRWMDVIHMMGNFVVVRADWRWDAEVVEYLAYSPLFDECPKECVAPEYNIIVAEENMMPATIKAVRLK
jgi:hypothetical protein